MSFETVCKTCGAPSSPSVGVCPFCKTSFEVASSPHSASIEMIRKKYVEGKDDEALQIATSLANSDQDLMSDINFLLLYAKVLLESEGPEAKIRGLLSRVLIKEPNQQEAVDYLEILDAKEHFAKGANDPGEAALQKFLRRCPGHVHALFLLGTHMYWNNGDPIQSARYLEQCVRLRPNFLRAWACLGTIYKKLGNHPLAVAAFQKCLSLESDSQMKKFFQSQLA